MVIFAVVAQGLRPSLSSIETADDGLVTLCQQCWSAEPTGRPCAKVITGTLESMCTVHDVHIRKPLF